MARQTGWRGLGWLSPRSGLPIAAGEQMIGWPSASRPLPERRWRPAPQARRHNLMGDGQHSSPVGRFMVAGYQAALIANRLTGLDRAVVGRGHDRAWLLILGLGRKLFSQGNSPLLIQWPRVTSMSGAASR